MTVFHANQDTGGNTDVHCVLDRDPVTNAVGLLLWTLRPDSRYSWLLPYLSEEHQRRAKEQVTLC